MGFGKPNIEIAADETYQSSNINPKDNADQFEHSKRAFHSL
jgi:hypothetical protein